MVSQFVQYLSIKTSKMILLDLAIFAFALLGFSWLLGELKKMMGK